MEVWILLAAAGSGYLARRWQIAHHIKGSSTHKSDEQSVGPFSLSHSHKEQNCHLPGRQPRTSTYGKKESAQVWDSPRNRYATDTGSSAVEGEKGSCQEGHNVCESHEDHDMCRSPGAKIGHQMPLADSHSYLFQDDQISDVLVGRSICQKEDSAFSFQDRNQKWEEDASVLRPDLLWEKNSDKAAISVEDCVNCETSMSGFWNLPNHVFMLDSYGRGEADSLTKVLTSDKVKAPNNCGNNRVSNSRRKFRALQKPMSSLESCLSAQLSEDYYQKTTGGLLPLFDVPSRDAILHSAGVLDTNVGKHLARAVVEVNRTMQTDTVVRLPSQTSQKCSSDTRVIMDKAAPCSGNQSCTFENALQDSSAVACRSNEDGCVQGYAGTSHQGLLFNFGVGVGMMFTVMSNVDEVERLTMLLKETESLIRVLEGEHEGRKNMEIECVPPNMKTEHMSSDRRLLAISNTLKRVRSETQALSSIRLSLNDKIESSSNVEHLQSKDMTKLEAELEAELERMELNLFDKSMPSDSYCWRVSQYLELGATGNQVQGELKVTGLPGESRLESEDLQGSHFVHENYTVSPRKLALRLHEVLQAQQEERISELEHELKCISSKLQAKEEELQWLKNKLPVVPSGADVGSSSSFELNDTQSCTQMEPVRKKGYTSVQVKNSLFSPRSPNASPVSPQFDGKFTLNTMESSPLRRETCKSSTTIITLQGEALEAYNEACSEISKVRNNSAPVTHSGSVSRVGKHTDEFHKDTRVKDCDTTDLQQVSSDYLEQVDLVSLAEDLYTCGDSQITVDTAKMSNKSAGRKYLRNRGSRKKGNHPEPEHLCWSKAADSTDESTNDTSGSTPCSVKFVDMTTPGCYYSDEVLIDQVGVDIDNESKPSYPGWRGAKSVHAGESNPSDENLCSSSLNNPRVSDMNKHEDNDSTSDLDEQLGHLLIKRIVEKCRKGSPIIQDAEMILATMENNESLVAPI